MVRKFDFIVVGSGIAGMSFALKVAHKGKVAILCKNKLEESNTHYAQGGIASVTNETDNFEKHISDTLIAGDGICNEEVVRMVVENAPKEIGGFDVVKVADYKMSTMKSSNGETTEIKLPKSNVLSYYLADGSKVIVRPSGTEPKIKAYITACGEARKISEEKADLLGKSISELLGV